MAGSVTFRFMDLPRELRDRIWEMAIEDQEGHRQAHFFSFLPEDAYEADVWTYTNAMPKWQNLLRFQTCMRPLGWDLVDPDFAGPAQVDPSGYLAASGVWTACKESTETAERKHREIWGTGRETSLTSVIFQDDRTTAAGQSIPGVTGRRQHATIRPGLELFHLESAYLAECGWLQFGMTQWRHDIEDEGKSSNTTWMGSPLHHAALDYDPRWKDQFEHELNLLDSLVPNSSLFYWSNLFDSETTLGSALRAFRYFTETKVLWFIDYRLQTRRDIDWTEKEKERHVFHAADRVLFEVTAEDAISEDMYLTEEDADSEWAGCETYFPMAHDLLEDMQTHLNYLDRLGELCFSSNKEHGEPPELGVLACVFK